MSIQINFHICYFIVVHTNDNRWLMYRKESSSSFLAYNCIRLDGIWHIMTRNEHGISFVDGNQNSLLLSESSPFDYGSVIKDEVDFDVWYSLTLNQQRISDPARSNSRICLYLIAAHPEIIPVSFHGNTTYLWQSIEGTGENFWLM